MEEHDGHLIPGQPFNPEPLFRRYIIVPQGVLRLTEIGSSEKLILMTLYHLSRRNGRVFPKQKTIAEWTGLSIDTVNGCIKKLEQKKFIQKHTPTGVDRWKHRSCEYVFLFHEALSSSLKIKGQESEDSGVGNPKIPVSLESEDSGVVIYNKNNIYEEKNIVISEKPRRTFFPKIYPIKTPNQLLLEEYGKIASLFIKASGKRAVNGNMVPTAHAIKRIITQDGIPEDRLETFLKWYIDNLGHHQYTPTFTTPYNLSEKWPALEAAMIRQEIGKKQAQRDKFNNRRAYQTDRHDESKHEQLQWTKSDDELLAEKTTRVRVIPLTPQEIAEGKTL